MKELGEQLSEYPDSYPIGIIDGQDAIELDLSVGMLTVMFARSEALERQQQTIDELVEALELLMASVEDIRGVDIREYCPIAFKGAENALAKAKL